MKTSNRIRSHRSATGAPKQSRRNVTPSTGPATEAAKSNAAPDLGDITEHGIPRAHLALLKILHGNAAIDYTGIGGLKPGLINQLLQRYGWKLNYDQAILELCRLCDYKPALVKHSERGYCLTLDGVALLAKHDVEGRISAGKITLALQDLDKGGVEPLMLESGLFLKLAKVAKSKDLGVADFVKQAVSEKVSTNLIDCERLSKARNEMDDAIPQASALFDLLIEKIGGLRGQSSDLFLHGLEQLRERVESSLTNAFTTIVEETRCLKGGAQ